MCGPRISVTLALVVIVLVIHGSHGQINHDKFEGDSCKMNNGAAGVCRRVKNCPAFRLPARGQRPPSSGTPPICSFLGTGPRSEPIICCASVKEALTAGNTPTPVPGIGSRIGGVKSKKACDEFIQEKKNKFRSQSVVPLILQGEETAVGEFPHMALLGYDVRGGQKSWSCGGALISDRYVLTAAHCLRTKDGSPKRVRLGEHDLADNNDAAVTYGVAEVIIHPQYGRSNSKSWYDDIGLIRLDKKVVFTREIFPACLHAQAENPSRDLIVTGWGATDEGGFSRSDVLLKGINTLELVPAQTCNSFYPPRQVGVRLANGIQASMFCAVDPKGAVDTCQGDSGGPIQVATEVSDDSFVYHVVGVTSAGNSICGASPAIYSRVYYYLDWIEARVWP